EEDHREVALEHAQERLAPRRRRDHVIERIGQDRLDRQAIAGTVVHDEDVDVGDDDPAHGVSAPATPAGATGTGRCPPAWRRSRTRPPGGTSPGRRASPWR